MIAAGTRQREGIWHCPAVNVQFWSNAERGPDVQGGIWGASLLLRSDKDSIKLARPTTIPRARAVETERKAISLFLIAKTKFYDRLRGQLNERQDKAIARMMREGPGGFKGGLSAENYIRLTGTSRATATRDLQDLVQKQALLRTGTLKGTRYHLPITLTPVP